MRHDSTGPRASQLTTWARENTHLEGAATKSNDIVAPPPSRTDLRKGGVCAAGVFRPDHEGSKDLLHHPNRSDFNWTHH